MDKHEQIGRSDYTNAFLNANCVFCTQVEAHMLKSQEAINAGTIITEFVFVTLLAASP